MKTFKDFYNKTKQRFFGYLVRMTGDYELSRDIMQESFTRYLERYGSCLFSVSLLFTIGRNNVMDNYRKKSRVEQTVDFLPEEAVNKQEADFFIREEYRQVLKAMDRLKTQERDILSMVVTSGLSYKEIADILDLSESNIKVKIHRIRLKLKKFLATG